MSLHCYNIENLCLVGMIPYHYECCLSLGVFLKENSYDALALQLPAWGQEGFEKACSRLPSPTAIQWTRDCKPTRCLVEAVDPFFEAARSFLEMQKPFFCIDSDSTPPYLRPKDLPDPHAIASLGHSLYFEKVYSKLSFKSGRRQALLAAHLNALKLKYDRVLVILHYQSLPAVVNNLKENKLAPPTPTQDSNYELYHLEEKQLRELMANPGYLSSSYEEVRQEPKKAASRPQLLYNLWKKAKQSYEQKSPLPLPPSSLKTFMKFSRNYALTKGQLSLDLCDSLTVAKGCADSHFAYHFWEEATHYPYHSNIDNLPTRSWNIKDFWSHEKSFSFLLKEKSPKHNPSKRYKNSKQSFSFSPHPYTLCSHTPEDALIEDFGHFLKKKSSKAIKEKTCKSLPFSTSLEEGIDMRETLRHWHEKKIYVKVQQKKSIEGGSVVLIFDEDESLYTWKSSWLGEHDQESDMAFFATPMGLNIIGPGICRCSYGGFLMTYPPRRLFNPFQDPDYQSLEKACDTLLAAAIDYSLQPLVSYVAPSPPSKNLVAYATKRGIKIHFIPLKELCGSTLQKLQAFHVLDGHDRREIANDFIF